VKAYFNESHAKTVNIRAACDGIFVIAVLVWSDELGCHPTSRSSPIWLSKVQRERYFADANIAEACLSGVVYKDVRLGRIINMNGGVDQNLNHIPP